jgi:hypothetical protein
MYNNGIFVLDHHHEAAANTDIKNSVRILVWVVESYVSKTIETIIGEALKAIPYKMLYVQNATW